MYQGKQLKKRLEGIANKVASFFKKSSQTHVSNGNRTLDIWQIMLFHSFTAILGKHPCQISTYRAAIAGTEAGLVEKSWQL